MGHKPTHGHAWAWRSLPLTTAHCPVFPHLPSIQPGASPMLPLVLLALAAPDAAPLTLHVAPAGNDANGGRPDAPFASPAKAVAAARALRTPGQPVRVVLAGGRYELAEPLVLTPADSHTEIVAADGAAV